MRLKGKIAIVTGAASGIGRAIAERFHAEGASVIVADLEVDEAFSGENRASVRLDVTRERDWEETMGAVVQKFGTPDILVNNAGISGKTALLIKDLSLADWQRVLSVNLDGAFLGTRAALRAMAGTGGSIINIASIHSFVAAAGTAAYSASKGGLTMLTKVAAVEGAASEVQIRVNSLHPGYIETPLLTARFSQAPDRRDAVLAATPARRLGQPEEVASAALYLASDESAFTTGASLTLDGGYTAI